VSGGFDLVEQARDDLRREWGEAFWTHPVERSIAVVELALSRALGVPSGYWGKRRTPPALAAVPSENIEVTGPARPALRLLDGGAG
jgi:hypothetical protein